MGKIGKKLLAVLVSISMLSVCGSSLAKVERADIPQEALSYAYWDTSLSAEERAADLISHMTLAEKVSELGSHPGAAIDRLGVAEYWYPGENLNGIANMAWWYGTDASDADSSATSFPGTLAQGSTWNTELIGEMGDAIGDEARAYYNTSKKGLSHWGPSVNLARDPRWGRTGDSFTEDVVLSSTLGSAFVKGFQGDYDDVDGVLKAIACLKHFVANNAEYTRSGGSSDMSEAELWEYYYRNFENMVDESDPACIMAAYNSVNGIPNHANYDMLTNLLRLTWGFTGWVVSDNTGVENLSKVYGTEGTNTSQESIDEAYKSDETLGEDLPVLDGGDEDYNGLYNLDVTTTEDAAVAAIEAGVSLDLHVADTNAYQQELETAVEDGSVSEATLDKALLEIFTTRFETGEFDLDSDVYQDGYQSETALIEQNQDLAEQVSTESIVMLENDGILPVNAKNYDYIMVIGEYADTMIYSDYASTDTEWRQENVDVTMYQGIKDYMAEANPDATVDLITLTDADEDGNLDMPTFSMEQAAQLDKDSTLIVYIVSTKIAALTNGGDAGEGNDRTTLEAPRGQMDIASQLNSLNKNTVVFLNTQSIVDLNDVQDDNGAYTGAALLWASNLGEKQGAALANVVFGQSSPSGHLTVTWYADETQLGELQHDYSLYADEEDGDYGRTYMYFTGDKDYNFGYGLSYSTFAYSNMTLDQTDVTGDDTINMTVDVTNTGDTDAYELVQLYAVGPNAAEENRPSKQLIGYQKVYLTAGETQTVTVPVKVFDLSCWNEDDAQYEMDLGDYSLYLGSDCETPIDGCTATFTCSADVSDTLYTATIVPADFVLSTGDTTASTASVSLVDNTLYATAAEVPADIALTYTSSDDAVASVAADGTITANAPGVCSITLTATLNGDAITDTAPIVVSE